MGDGSLRRPHPARRYSTGSRNDALAASEQTGRHRCGIHPLPRQDSGISRGMLRSWGGRARQRWSEEIYQKDLNDKLVFADNGEFFAGAPYLMSIVQPMESTLLDYADSPILILDEPEVL